MKRFRHGYADPEIQKRLTPKSAFLRKLERTQRVRAYVEAALISEVYAAPPPKAPRLTLVRK